ncbi:MAG: pyridoxal phosphate-dependent aminotransferase, partial [Lachnospiraceae bacterium]|nr:pyridoxal phosphate-dependent aminotransferase [Lachnospiraceae bacterium]
PTSSYIEDALAKVAHHNIYGYSNTQEGDGFFEAVAGWMKRHHNFIVERDWHVKTPGVTFAIAHAIRAVTQPGDAVIIQQPVYYPFSSIIRENKRKMVSNDLVIDDEGSYHIDFEDFERKVTENDVKLFILCNPHNPVGRVWTKEELIALGDICQKHGVIVFSDEIHFDFIWKGDHHVFQDLKEDYKDFTITATAPSKTFNLAGLQQSNIFVPNESIRRKFRAEISATGYDEPNIFGITAAQTAYESGDEWYDAATSYIKGNIDFAADYVKKNLPGVRLIDTQGTYLIWLDFRNLGINAVELDDILVNKAKLWLDSGRIFGKAGEGFQRINTTCPRSILKEALDRIANVI